MTYQVPPSSTESPEAAPLPKYLPARMEDVSHSWQYFSGFPLFTMTLGILLFVVYSYSNLHGYISDEGYHAKMIDALLRKEWDNLPTNVTTPPFFHAIIAFFIHISGAKSQLLELMRAIQLVISLGAIPCFYLVAARLRQQDCDMRLLLCLCLPLYTPLLNLVYTDPPAVTFTLLMTFFMLKGNHWLAALIGVLGIGIRQMTVIWACFCTVYTLISYFEAHAERSELRKALTSIKELAKAIWLVLPYLLPAAAFIGYTLYNGGIVAGDKVNHSTSFNLGNFFFFLLTSFIIFLPYVIGAAKDVLNMVCTKVWLWFLIPITLVAYLYFYKITHVYNNPDMSWWIHNQLFAFSTKSAAIKALFFIPIALMLLTYIHFLLSHKKPWQMALLYAFALLSFVPLPLVEARYYLVGLLFFILWKPTQSIWAERCALIYMMILSFYVVNGASTKSFFL